MNMHKSEATFIISHRLHKHSTVYYVYEVYAVIPYVINTRILADHLESLVVKTLSTSGLHIIEQNTLYFGFESP